jgi:hypothetical protein
MGPKKAPAHFQEQMAATCLLGLIYYICEVYLDDIIVHGKTNEEFIFNLREVFKRNYMVSNLSRPNVDLGP